MDKTMLGNRDLVLHTKGCVCYEDIRVTSPTAKKLAQVMNRTVTELDAEDLRGVTKIPLYALTHCKTIKSVTLPDGVTSVGERAFFECSCLTSVVIPASVKTFGTYAFTNCSMLSQVTFAEGSTLGSITTATFANCTALESIKLPPSITSIGSTAFKGCSNLKCVDMTAYKSLDDFPTLENVSAFNGVPTDFKIRVREGLGDVIYNTNWSDYSANFEFVLVEDYYWCYTDNNEWVQVIDQEVAAATYNTSATCVCGRTHYYNYNGTDKVTNCPENHISIALSDANIYEVF